MIKKFLDLGFQPIANKYLTKKDLLNKRAEDYYHLEVGLNTKTKLVSILNTIIGLLKHNKDFSRFYFMFLKDPA